MEMLPPQLRKLKNPYEHLAEFQEATYLPIGNTPRSSDGSSSNQYGTVLPPRHLTILIVEDNKFNQSIVKRMIEDHGWTVRPILPSGLLYILNVVGSLGGDSR